MAARGRETREYLGCHQWVDAALLSLGYVVLDLVAGLSEGDGLRHRSLDVTGNGVQHAPGSSVVSF